MSGPTFVEDGKKPIHKQSTEKAEQEPQKAAPAQAILNLQGQIGNRATAAAVQRMMAQRSGDGSFEVNDDVESRINQHRGSGQNVDGAVQAQMQDATGFDFSSVRVHTSPEADQLNQQLGAKAFTTGQDIFFRNGAYSPGSSAGQELLAHEMTHVVQQSSGAVSSPGGMRVNAPGDQYEQQADQVAKSVLSPSSTEAGNAPTVQREEIPEDEVDLKRDPDIQRQGVPEEEDPIQPKLDPALQRQESPEEDELP